MGSYGIGQGLKEGVNMAGSFIVPAMRDRMVMDRRERMFDKELASNAGMLAGRDAAFPMRGTPTSGAQPSAAETLAGAPTGESMTAAPGGPMDQQPAPGAVLAGQEEAFTPLSEQDVYTMYKQAEQQRVTTAIRSADEMDIARGWNRTKTNMDNVRRSLVAIQSAMKDDNAAMVLVPSAADPQQAKQVLAGEYMKLLPQYKQYDVEFKQWDARRHELGIDPKEISTEPGIAQWLNRKQQQQRGGSSARPGARSVVPTPRRGAGSVR